MTNLKKRRRRVNATGRNDGERYANLGYPMMQSPAWRSLRGSALKVLIELRTRYDGGNNGNLMLPYEQAATLLGLSKSSVSRAFAELQTKGFIVEMERGNWYGRKASLWALTFLHRDGMPATHDWKRWDAPENHSLGTVAEPLMPSTVPPEYRRNSHGAA